MSFRPYRRVGFYHRPTTTGFMIGMRGGRRPKGARSSGMARQTPRPRVGGCVEVIESSQPGGIVRTIPTASKAYLFIKTRSKRPKYEKDAKHRMLCFRILVPGQPLSCQGQLLCVDFAQTKSLLPPTPANRGANDKVQEHSRRWCSNRMFLLEPKTIWSVRSRNEGNFRG
jgi:hypothetical protein